MQNQLHLTISSASTVFGQIILFLIGHGSKPLPPIGWTNLLFEPYFYGGIFKSQTSPTHRNRNGCKECKIFMKKFGGASEKF